MDRESFLRFSYFLFLDYCFKNKSLKYKNTRNFIRREASLLGTMGCVCEKIDRGTKMKKANPKADSNQNVQTLTDSQKELIRNNWQIIKCQVANIGVITYVSMFESRPELIHIFSSFKGRELSELQQTGLLRQHALRVMATIDKCISRLDEPTNMQNILKEVGIHHNRYKVPVEYVEDILPHFLSAIRPHIGDSWDEESSKAWTILLSIIVHYIKDGMKETC